MKKVLLIDDDPITNFINQKLIENTGLAGEIVIAENGRQGLKILVDIHANGELFPDLIVLDINMPLLDGFDFLQQLYKLKMTDPANMKIAILSCSDNSDDREKAKELGIDSYLVKPITAGALIDLLL
jgi:CheY-like chemotaxis protein